MSTSTGGIQVFSQSSQRIKILNWISLSESISWPISINKYQYHYEASLARRRITSPCRLLDWKSWALQSLLSWCKCMVSFSHFRFFMCENTGYFVDVKTIWNFDAFHYRDGSSWPSQQQQGWPHWCLPSSTGRLGSWRSTSTTGTQRRTSTSTRWWRTKTKNKTLIKILGKHFWRLCGTQSRRCSSSSSSTAQVSAQRLCSRGRTLGGRWELSIVRVGKCQIFYTDQYQQTRFYPEKSV